MCCILLFAGLWQLMFDFSLFTWGWRESWKKRESVKSPSLSWVLMKVWSNWSFILPDFRQLTNRRRKTGRIFWISLQNSGKSWRLLKRFATYANIVLRRNLFLCRRTVCSGGTAPTSASSSSPWWSGRDGSNNNFAILVVTNTPRLSVGTTYDRSVWEEVWTSDSWQSITVQSGHSRGQPLPRQNICSFLKWTIFLSTLFRKQTSSIFCIKDEKN